MNRRIGFVLCAAVLFAGALFPPLDVKAAQASAPSVVFRKTSWDDLIPPEWNPTAILQKLQVGKYGDGDPRSDKALEAMKEEWDNAPGNKALDGRTVRLEGYIVPLKADKKGAMTDMLLVPYFGACVHSPPPPANQIVHVVFDPGRKGFEMMMIVRVKGTLRLRDVSTMMGAAAYRLDGIEIESLDE